MKPEDFERVKVPDDALYAHLCVGCYFDNRREYGVCMADVDLFPCEDFDGENFTNYIFRLKLTESELKQLNKEL